MMELRDRIAGIIAAWAEGGCEDIPQDVADLIIETSAPPQFIVPPNLSDVVLGPGRIEAITADNLPEGPKWEEDGACWQAMPLPYSPGWRWGPLNGKALAKGEPQGPMTDCIPFRRGDEVAIKAGRRKMGTSGNG